VLNFVSFLRSRAEKPHASTDPNARLCCALPALLFAALCCLPTTARADASSGTYTGSVSLRGNYYWEESTRVVAPSVSAALATPSGVRLDGTYLLDAITSASVATGVATDNAFTEKRNDGQGGIGYEFDFGGAQLDVSARVRMSKEPDYVSRGAGLSAGLSLNQRNTLLRFNGYYLHDEVYRIVRMAPPTNQGELVASEAQYLGPLDVVSLGWSWDQVLGRQSTMTLGYDLSLLDGFQANAYRVATRVTGGPKPETHPEQRTRNAPYVWLSHFVLATRTAFRFGYRLYRDNWDLLAHAPDFRIHQEIGPYVELRLRYRYYTQNSSFFYRPGPYLETDTYVTGDPKMRPFHDHTAGLKVRVSLEFLAATHLRALRMAVVDWTFEYIFSNNTYNNNKYYDGFVAQGGVLFPF